MLLLNFGPKPLTGDIYRGRPAQEGHYKNGSLKKPLVTVNGKRLDPRFDLHSFSPTGFSWGYGGAGPSQLGMAVLAHAAGDDIAREEWYRFRQAVIRKLDMQQPFAFSADDVAAFLGGRRLDASRFIRPVRTRKEPGWRESLKQLLKKPT
jgi:Family of unknown function (DUF6166)